MSVQNTSHFTISNLICLIGKNLNKSANILFSSKPTSTKHIIYIWMAITQSIDPCMKSRKTKQIKDGGSCALQAQEFDDY